MVIDSSERERINTVKDELNTLLSHEVRFFATFSQVLPRNRASIIDVSQPQDLRDAALCVFANKQDLKGSMSPAEITEALALHSIKSHDWQIQPCCALTGDGISEGLDWIVARVSPS